MKRQDGWGRGCWNITLGTARSAANTRLTDTELQWLLDISINTANTQILEKDGTKALENVAKQKMTHF